MKVAENYSKFKGCRRLVYGDNYNSLTYELIGIACGISGAASFAVSYPTYIITNSTLCTITDNNRRIKLKKGGTIGYVLSHGTQNSSSHYATIYVDGVAKATLRNGYTYTNGTLGTFNTDQEIWTAYTANSWIMLCHVSLFFINS